MRSLAVFQGVELDVSSVDEPRIRDLELAARAGLKDVHTVRRVIARNAEELAAHGTLSAFSARQPENGRGRPGAEYWLNEDQAVALVALMRTPLAREVRIALVKAFRASREGKAPAAPVAKVVPLDIAHGPRVGDDPRLRADMSAHVLMVARATARSRQSIQGWIRKTYRVGSEMHVSALAWELVRATLQALALGKLLLPAPARPRLRLVASNPRQPSLPGLEASS
jgi:hypothetical protein